MHMRRLSVLLLALACSACLRSETVINLRPDGSGTVVQENAMSAQALAMLKSMVPANPNAQTAGAMTSPFGEEQARKTADKMGVTFVSGEPFKTADLEGYRARYSFDDITKVKVSMDDAASAGQDKGTTVPFGLTFDRGAASSVLTIQMPEKKPGSPDPLKQLPVAPGGGDPAMAAQAMSMMKMMMKGLYIDISLNAGGRIIKTNAPHVDGTRVTLLQVDFDKLLADESALQKLQQAGSELKNLAGIPGLKVVTDPKVAIEFAK
jgi:hypothetical protein